MFFYFLIIYRSLISSYYIMKKIAIFLLCLTLWGCTDNSDNLKYTIIQLNDYLESPSIDITDRIDSVYIVPLQTTDESLIGDINKIIITDTRIIVYYSSSYEGGICIFEKNGRFVSKVSSGNGPEELIGDYQICYDKDHREILVAQNNGYIKHLSEDGAVLGEERYNYSFSNMQKIPEGYFFSVLAGMNDSDDELYNVSLYKTDNNLLLDKKLLFKNNLPNYGDIAIHEYNDELYVTQALNDTVYCIGEDGGVEPKYILDYSKSHFDVSEAKDVSSLIRELSRQDAYNFDGLYLESDDYQYLCLMNIGGNTMLNVFINKHDGRVLASPRLETDKSKLPFIQTPLLVHDNYFVTLVHSSDIDNIQYSKYLSKEEVDKLNGMMDDDNNILLFFKLKR